MLLGLLYAVRLPQSVSFLRFYLSPRRNLEAVYVKVLRPLAAAGYRFFVGYLGWWPIGLFSGRVARGPVGAGRAALYLWHFPVLSQTFVQREIEALKRSGLTVVVVADDKGDTSQLSESALVLLRETRYLLPVAAGARQRYHRYFITRHPLRYLNLLLYVVCRRYGAYKNFSNDLAVFERVVYLAGVLKDEHVRHVHALWADRCAFIALVASRLLGITYSVQARAHDIHRRQHQFALKEKFTHANFVVTNSEYNSAHIRTFLKRHDVGKVHTVYEGIDLEQFRPKQSNRQSTDCVKLLCVARLVEEKGLVVLLQACKILQDQGRPFHCRIVGGPEFPLYRDYYLTLKKTHKALGLQDCVAFMGAQPFAEVMKHYDSADIFVLPCVVAKNGGRDISPNALLEAMAMALPVISTTISAIPEIIEDGVSGVLVPPHDAAALAAAIQRLSDDPCLRRRLGKHAREKVQREFHITKNMATLVRLYGATPVPVPARTYE
jgi:glycosyltransferase involved in cell wall biosynthesis